MDAEYYTTSDGVNPPAKPVAHVCGERVDWKAADDEGNPTESCPTSGHGVWKVTLHNHVQLNVPTTVDDDLMSGPFTNTKLDLILPKAVSILIGDSDTPLDPDDVQACNYVYHHSTYNPDNAPSVTLTFAPAWDGACEDGDIDLASVHAKFGLGSTAGGSAGAISLEMDTLDSTSCAPSHLAYRSLRGVESIPAAPSAANPLRQIRAAQCFVDVVALPGSPSYGYEIRFYPPLPTTAAKTGGFYTPTGSPTTVWKVENPDTSGNTANDLWITETRISRTRRNEYSFAAANDTWTLTKGDVDGNGNLVNPVTKSRQASDMDSGDNAYTEIEETIAGASGVVSRVLHDYKTFSWGTEEIQTIVGSTEQLATQYTFLQGKQSSVLNPDGSYDVDGHGPYLDAPTFATAKSAYDSHGTIGGWERSSSDTGSYEIINGQPVRSSLLSNGSVVSVSGRTATVKYEDDFYSVTGSQRTTTATYASSGNLAPWKSQPAYTIYPDGRQDTWSYAAGNFLAGASPDGQFHASSTGLAVQKTLTHGTVASPGGVAGLSTQERSTYDEKGQLALEETLALPDCASDYVVVSTTAHTYDTPGHRIASVKNGRTIYNASWVDGRLLSETDEQGVITAYSNFDGQGRALTVTKTGVSATGSYAAQADLPTSTSEDAAGRTLGQTVGASGGPQQTTTTTYDTAGRVTSETSNGLTTATSYSADNLTVTRTMPNGATEITANYLDGRVKSVTGTAQVARYYTYGVEAGTGNQWTTVALGSATSPRWTTTTADWLGRTVRVETPTFRGTGVNTVASFYDPSSGLLVKTTRTGLADTLYVYDAMGNQIKSGLDMDATGALENSSTDRITQSKTIYGTLGSACYRISTTSTRLDNGSLQTLGGQVEQLTGLPAGTLSSVQTQDASGQLMLTVTTVDRANKLVTTTTTVPSATNQAVQVALNGLTVSSSTPAVTAPVLYAHDALGRQSAQTDPGTGAVTTITYDAASGQVASTVTANGSLSLSTVNTYYGASEASPGQLKSATVNGRTTNYTYTLHNQVWQVSGDTYPLAYTYDGYDARQTLTTTGAAGNSVTTWVYDAATGLLQQKKDAANKGPTYTYYPFGGVQTRTWARGVTTTYSFDAGGTLTGTVYSDGLTPNVTIANNRQSRPGSVTDAAGAHTLTYTPDGQLMGDAVGGSGLLAGTSVSVGYDAFLRRNALSASNGGSLSYSVGCGYDTATGNLAGVTDNTSGTAVTYGYQANSTQLGTTTFKHNGTTRLVTARNPDGLGRLASITNTAGMSVASSHAYVYDAHGQRSQATLADGTVWKYTYNARGELTGGHHYLSNGTTEIPGQQFDYAYDDIGNRTQTTTNGRTATYTPNALNQYTQRGVPGTVDVLGTADTGAAVTVNNQAATRQGNYFYKGLNVDPAIGQSPGTGNTGGPVNQHVDVLAVKAGAGAGGADVISETQGSVFLPKTPEQFAYDDDGNLTQDGQWTYIWDGENRLIGMTALTSVPAAAKKKLVFAYDWMLRRFSKQVYGWNAGTNTYTTSPGVALLFVYDGWNVIDELDANGGNIPQRIFLWGHDLSGDMQSSGGVGGLLALESFDAGMQTQYVLYDGSANIIRLANGASGSVNFQYEYGPFGETTRDTKLACSPFRFSSQYVDQETNLVYAKYRWYQVSSGNFISRDPVGEGGGINLFNYTHNSPVSYYDAFGLSCITSIYVEFSSRNAGDQKVLENHDNGYNYKTGHVYSGAMYVKYDDGTEKSWDVHDGGYRRNDSHVRGPSANDQIGDDSVTPAGNWRISTTQGGRLNGFQITVSGDRNAILAHDSQGKIGTHGCVGITDNFQAFACDMKAAKDNCRSDSLPIYVRYLVSDGEQPKGSRGDGKNDPELPPPPGWPGPDPGPTNSEKPY